MHFKCKLRPTDIYITDRYKDELFHVPELVGTKDFWMPPTNDAANGEPPHIYQLWTEMIQSTVQALHVQISQQEDTRI